MVAGREHKIEITPDAAGLNGPWAFCKRFLIEGVLDGDSPRGDLSWNITNDAVGAPVIAGSLDREPSANSVRNRIIEGHVGMAIKASPNFQGEIVNGFGPPWRGRQSEGHWLGYVREVNPLPRASSTTANQEQDTHHRQ